MRTSQGKGAKGKATRLHAKIIRDRGFCESCGTTENLQCAHIISRRYSRTRTMLENAFCLCAGCHIHFTNWPLEFEAFVRARRPEGWYERTKALALDTTTKVAWDVEYERLRQIGAQIGVAL